jgi:phosphoadenosine phosphosulfate reductase
MGKSQPWKRIISDFVINQTVTNKMNQDLLHILQTTLPSLSPAEGLAFVAENAGGNAVFSTSFGLEDQAITHLVATQQLPVELFTLDTGRNFSETYSAWTSTLDRYKPLTIKAWYPDATDLQALVHANGPNSFYESVENRKACCGIRKVAPLAKALAGKSVWITGIRAAQSNNRQDMPQVEWDETHQLIKYHPLLHWTWEELKKFIADNMIPYNSLHDKGFVSIGCAPCTRAIRSGEDFRAGRWWWEDDSKKECGLHVHTTA